MPLTLILKILAPLLGFYLLFFYASAPRPKPIKIRWRVIGCLILLASIFGIIKDELDKKDKLIVEGQLQLLGEKVSSGDRSALEKILDISKNGQTKTIRKMAESSFNAKQEEYRLKCKDKIYGHLNSIKNSPIDDYKNFRHRIKFKSPAVTDIEPKYWKWKYPEFKAEILSKITDSIHLSQNLEIVAIGFYAYNFLTDNEVDVFNFKNIERMSWEKEKPLEKFVLRFSLEDGYKFALSNIPEQRLIPFYSSEFQIINRSLGREAKFHWLELGNEEKGLPFKISHKLEVIAISDEDKVVYSSGIFTLSNAKNFSTDITLKAL